MYQSFTAFFKHAVKHEPTDLDYQDLKRAVATGDLVKTKALLDRFPIMMKAVDCNGYNILLQAFLTRPHPATLKLLLEKGLPIYSEIDAVGNTLLHVIAVNGSGELAEVFHDYEVNLDARNHRGRTPFSVAAEYANIDMLAWLHAEGINLAAKDDLGRTALHWGVAEGSRERSLEAVCLMLDGGANPDETDDQGVTPLMEAVRTGNVAMVRLLLDRFADPMKLSKREHCAFSLACVDGNCEMIEVMLACKVLPNPPLPPGRTLFHLLVVTGRADVLDLLAARGGNVNAADADGATPLHLAIAEGKDEVIRVLLKHGADPDCPDRAGQTPRALAEQKGQPISA